MYYEKSECERLIEESPLFQLDKELEPSAYRAASLKMVEYLYCYLMALNKTKYEEYALEIIDTAKRCIANFKPESGKFLHYFNSSWKQMYGHIVGKELVKNTFGGMHFTEEEERTFRKYMRFAQSMGQDTNTDEFNQKVAEAMDLSIDDIANLRMMIETRPTSGTFTNDEGEEFSLIDQIDSGIYSDSSILSRDSVVELLKNIQSVYDRLQSRQKPMMAHLITSKLAMLAIESDDFLDCFKGMPYFDIQIFEECSKRGEAIQAKEISDRLGVKEASTSRSWKAFKDKLKEHMKERVI